MKREKEFIKNLVVLIFGLVIPKFSTLITLPILTGGLTNTDYGTYDLICTIMALLLPTVTLQIQTACFRFLIDHREDDIADVIISNVLVFVVSVSMIALVIFFFLLDSFSIQLRFTICIYFFIDITFRVLQQIARGLGRNKWFSKSVIIESLTNLSILLIEYSTNKVTLLGVIISCEVASLLGLLYLIIKEKIFSRIHLAFISKSQLMELLQYSWPMIPNTLSAWVLKASDRLVISVAMGVAANAVYAAATKIPIILTTVQSAFTQAWQENASVVQKDEDVEMYYSKMFDMTFSFISGLLAVLIAATPLLFKILIKGDYESGYVQIPILYMGSYFSCISAFLGGIYVAYKKTKNVGVTTTVSAIINFLIDILLINKIGIFAASISTLVSYMFLAFYRMSDVQKFQKIKFEYGKIAVYLVLLSYLCVAAEFKNIFVDVVIWIVAIAFFLIANKNLLIEGFIMVKKKVGSNVK